jgi:hypothetical protein
MAYNDPNERPRRRTTGGDWWEDSNYQKTGGQNIGGESNYGLDNDRDYRFRERRWQSTVDPQFPAEPHPFETHFGTRMGNFGQIVYDPSYGIDSFGYHNDRPRREGNMEYMPSSNERDTSHRGRGPKNYMRSDERISEDVNDRLMEDPYVDASDIEVHIDRCEVILSGTVDSREAKRRAEDLAESVSGVRNVENRIRVRRDDNSSDSYKYPTATTSGGATNTDSKAEKDVREKRK